MSTHSPAGILKQPLAVWAIAFACVVSFMGIGLVDPILPAIARELQASPTETSLLFTTYLLITGAAMFFTSWLSSRIGPKRTLLIGLAVIVVFATLAGLADSVFGVIGFRAGWGLGNALFISTALATIIGASTGGAAGAIILYEAALGVGLAIGPLLGGLLGSVSWRTPFFGTAVLMAVGFIAVASLLRLPRATPQPTKLSAPFRALGDKALLTTALAALFYNMGFFVLLAWTPFALVPLGMEDAMTLGWIFFGWGLAVAISSVFVAPLLTARMRRTTVLLVILPLLAVTEGLMAAMASNATALIVLVVVGGLLLGVMNTVLTEVSMDATTLPRSVASSTYSGVRFLGGAVAPPLASWLGDTVFESTAAPFVFGVVALIVSAVMVATGRRHLRRADGLEETELETAEAIGVGAE